MTSSQTNNDNKKPLNDKIKDSIVNGAGFLSFVGSIVTCIVFILDQMKLSPLLTSTPNFVIIPVVTIICALLYFFIPNSINSLRKRIEKLKEKKTTNNHELNEIAVMITALNDVNETLTNKTKSQTNGIVINEYIENLRNLDIDNGPINDDIDVRSVATSIYIDSVGNKFKHVV